MPYTVITLLNIRTKQDHTGMNTLKINPEAKKHFINSSVEIVVFLQFRFNFFFLWKASLMMECSLFKAAC